MHKVFLHTHTKGDHDWVNEIKEFGRIPVEGEYLATDVDSTWYEVELIVHTPFTPEMEAEVYAVKVDHAKVKQKKLSTSPNEVYFPGAP